MRISDWSSDVCSSDLIVALTLAAITAHAVLVIAMYMSQDIANFVYGLTNAADHVDWYILDQGVRIPGLTYGLASTSVLYCFAFFASRSEEHTSELQSLMRSSYAVFCLKKKTKKQNKSY